MYKKNVKYVDYNGNSRDEDFYFNLTEAEVMEMEMSTTGGLAEHIQRIVAAQDAPSIIAIFKKLVLDAYGVKSPDGRQFIKNESLKREFEQTPAYSAIFMELAQDADAAAKFVNNIVPADVAKKANAKSIPQVGGTN